MNIAYGTYGMPTLAPEEALPAIAEIGYEGVEIAIGSKYPAHPDKLDADARKRVAGLLNDHNLALHSLMLQINVMASETSEHEANLGELRKAANLAKDLNPKAPPSLTFTMGGKSDQYEEQRSLLATRLRDFAEVAVAEGVMLAAEPHVKGTIDRPERGVWLIEKVDSPVVRLNFDISHFDLIGLGIDECVTPLVPLSIHTHVKDGRMVDGKVQFLLPGEGEFDYVAYLKAMQAAGWDGCICVEISGQIFGSEGYDPIAAAKFSYDTLRKAFDEAGV